jgi:hypothetical protein
MKKFTQIFTFISCFVILGFFHSASADTTYIYTANGRTDITSSINSTYTPGDAIYVDVNSIITSDPYVTHIELIANNNGAGRVIVVDAPLDIYSNISASAYVGIAGAPATGLNVALTGTVRTIVPATGLATIYWQMPAFKTGILEIFDANNTNLLYQTSSIGMPFDGVLYNVAAPYSVKVTSDFRPVYYAVCDNYASDIINNILPEYDTTGLMLIAPSPTAGTVMIGQNPVYCL